MRRCCRTQSWYSRICGTGRWEDERDAIRLRRLAPATPAAHQELPRVCTRVQTIWTTVQIRPPMPRSQASLIDRPDRKQAILLAAERLFAQEGYHAVSLRAIADEAGVPLALVNYYYGQKHELFRAIFDHW